MADCLVYWKDYWDDINKYGNQAVTAEWNTDYPHFCDQIQPGDNLWVVVWGGPGYPNEWRLIQRIRIRQLGFDKKTGQWYAKGNDRQSEEFDIHKQPDLTPILHKLRFASGRSITAHGRLIGRSIQRSRPLSNPDTVILNSYAKTLKNTINSQNGIGSSKKPHRRLISTTTNQYYIEGAIHEITRELRRSRDPHLREDAIRVKGIKCEVCEFDFEEAYGELGAGYVEIHHLHPLSEIEEGQTVQVSIDDVAVVCANCHRVLHRNGAQPISLEELRQAVVKRRRRRQEGSPCE